MITRITIAFPADALEAAEINIESQEPRSPLSSHTLPLDALPEAAAFVAACTRITRVSHSLLFNPEDFLDEDELVRTCAAAG